MNEALILAKRQDIMEKVGAVVEAFTDDILPAIGGSDLHVVCKLSEKRPDKLVISWRWDRYNMDNSSEFTLSVLDTADAFVNRVKAHLFDLAGTVMNL